MRDEKYVNSLVDEFDFNNNMKDFIKKLYEEWIIEKEDLSINLQKNEELFNEIQHNILQFQNKIEYEENVFDPNYSSHDMDLKLNQFKMKEESILLENERFKNQIQNLDKKIVEVRGLLKDSEGKWKNENSDEGEEKSKIEFLRRQECERKRIARDIHDTVVQKLTNLIHKSEFTLKIMDIDLIRAKLELMTISKSIKEIIDELRSIIYNLRPMAFDDIGIDVIIERELLNIKENGIKVSYDVVGECGNVDQTVQITLLRIIQEACNNAIKHSNFTEFCVKIVYSDEFIEVFIKDNGIGFQVKDENQISYETKSGFGLSMMKERVYLLSGLIDFQSSKEEGTSIYVKVPKFFREERKDGNKFSSC